MGALYHKGHWYGGGQDIDIQSDPTATSFDPNKVPTGATAQSVLDSIFPNLELVQNVTLTGCRTGSYFRVYKGGKIIYFEYYLITSADVAPSGSSGGLGTIDASYRPSVSIPFNVLGMSGGKYHSASLVIGTDGVISLVNTSTANTIFYAGGAGEYILH